MSTRDPLADIRNHIGYDYTLFLYSKEYISSIDHLQELGRSFASLEHEDALIFESFCAQTERNILRMENWPEQPVEDSAFAARNIYELALWVEWLNLDPEKHTEIFGGLLIQDLKDIENAVRLNRQGPRPKWMTLFEEAAGGPDEEYTCEEINEHWKQEAIEKNFPWVKWSEYGAGVFAAQLDRQEFHRDLYKLACKFAHPSPYSLVFPNHREDHSYYIIAFAGFCISGVQTMVHELTVALNHMKTTTPMGGP